MGKPWRKQRDLWNERLGESHYNAASKRKVTPENSVPSTQ